MIGKRCGGPNVVLGGNGDTNFDTLRGFEDWRGGDHDLGTGDADGFHDVVGHLFGFGNSGPRHDHVACGFIGSVVDKVTDHLQSRHLDSTEKEDKNDGQHNGHFDGVCTSTNAAVNLFSAHDVGSRYDCGGEMSEAGRKGVTW